MNRLGFVVGSRGLGNSFARAWQVASRFGVTATRMDARLEAYADIVGEYGSHPSLPITAAVMDRNPAVAKRLQDRGVELCVHGLVHNDLSMLSGDEQARQIGQAIGLFRKHAIRFSGFRSPYLKYNRATLEAVETAGFDYDSNLPFYWEPPGLLERLSRRETEGLRRGLAFYKPVSFPAERSLPRFEGGMIEIPVSLPDDEILLDRIGMQASRVGDIWLEMARMALQRGELLTLQLHPERLQILRRALSRTLEFARSSGDFWIATLTQISTWWRWRASARIVAKALGDGLFQAVPPESATGDFHIKVVEPGGGTRSLEPGQTVASGVRPVVGLHPDTSDDFRRFIREQGYLFEITENSSDYSTFVRREMESAGLEAAIGGAIGPLLMVDTWPRPYWAAIAVTGDIDCLTLGDFLRRFREG